jgi:hypothetical protein
MAIRARVHHQDKRRLGFPGEPRIGERDRPELDRRDDIAVEAGPAPGDPESVAATRSVNAIGVPVPAGSAEPEFEKESDK